MCVWKSHSKPRLNGNTRIIVEYSLAISSIVCSFHLHFFFWSGMADIWHRSLSPQGISWSNHDFTSLQLYRIYTKWRVQSPFVNYDNRRRFQGTTEGAGELGRWGVRAEVICCSWLSVLSYQTDLSLRFEDSHQLDTALRLLSPSVALVVAEVICWNEHGMPTPPSVTHHVLEGRWREMQMCVGGRDFDSGCYFPALCY